jgi:hypothetical protein
VGDDLGDALGLCELLCELHHQPRYGDATRGPEEFGLVCVLHAHCCCPAHDIFGVRLYVVPLEVCELLLEIAHLVLEVHDIVPGDLAPFGRVIVLAMRICPFARPAPRQSGVASRLALGECQWWINQVGGQGQVQPYSAAATTGSEGMRSATLSSGAFLSGLRCGFRLRLRRGRDFHSLSSTVNGQYRLEGARFAGL